MSDRVEIVNGDSLLVLQLLDDNSVDAIVTDPPYGLSFMGKKWDYDVPSDELWRQCLRVLKPGGHLLAFAGTRTQHRMAVRIEDAGFEIRDMIAYVYGSGFPKSLDVSKAIDKQRDDSEDIHRVVRWIEARRVESGVTRAQVEAHFGTQNIGQALFTITEGSKSRVATWEQWIELKSLLKFDNEMDAEVWRLNGRKGKPGEAFAEREVVGQKTVNGEEGTAGGYQNGIASVRGSDISIQRQINITAPATDAAKQWQGWGTALKPALEPITVARKPLIGTVAENVLQYGTGAINVDGGRVGTHKDVPGSPNGKGITSGYSGGWGDRKEYMSGFNPNIGRWPANFIHDGSEEATDLLKDSARFFYCAKASKADRDAGLDSIEIISIFAAWEKEDLQVRLLVDTATSPPRVTVESTVQHKNASAWSTLLFGSQFMERFQTATKYTTSTEISSTIASRTLRALAHCITNGYIPGVSCVQTDGTNHAVSAATSNTLTITIDEATASVLGANPAQSRMQFRISANDGRNIHSTVKPTDLMRYLCRLVTPPNGVVLDPFMGSGSTGKAAVLEGFRFIGIEREEEYCEIAKARIKHAQQ